MNGKDTNYYLFVVSGLLAPTTKTWISATKVTESRLKLLRWPVRSGTKHRNQLKAGDRALIYVAGKDVARTTVIARLTVDGGQAELKLGERIDSDWIGEYSNWRSYIPIKDHVFINPPVSISNLVNTLDFITNKTNWGSHMQGGIRQITTRDYSTITNSSS